MRTRRLATLAAVTIALALVAYVARGAILGTVGRHLTAQDPLATAEVAVITPESAKAGELEAADLYAAGTVSRVVVLEPVPTPAERELARRQIITKRESVERLGRLGIPLDRIGVIDAGEGGTTSGTAAITDWFVRHPARGVIVITSPSHARRVGRVLRRSWTAGQPPPRIRAATWTGFEPGSWWQHRRSLRDGLVEIQKLLLDYVAHPL